MEALLPRLPNVIEPAWRSLGAYWKYDPGMADPCSAAPLQQLQCYRTADVTVSLLRQLGRPGILTLQKAKGVVAFAVVTGLTDQTATLKWGSEVHQVTLGSLARFWRGDFSTYWQPPVGYQPDLREGAVSPVMGMLSGKLSQLEGKPQQAGAADTMALDSALIARVKAFQAGHGIKADGQAGPMTFMLIDKALGGSGPSLEIR